MPPPAGEHGSFLDRLSDEWEKCRYHYLPYISFEKPDSREFARTDPRRFLDHYKEGAVQRFVRLCAGCTGRFLNLSNLGDDAGVSHNTAREWISVLKAGFVLFRLPPHHASFSKRIVRTPKLYFRRDRPGLEVDALIDLAGTLHSLEAKSGATVTDDMFRALKRWRAFAGAHAGSSFLVHGGSQRQERHAATVLPWNDPVPPVLGGS